MAERKITNNTTLLFLSTDNVDFSTVVCGTKIGRALTVDEIDASSNCGNDKEPGSLSGNISFEGQHLLDPSTGKVSGHNLFTWMIGKTLLYYKIGPALAVDGDVIGTGQCFISQLDDNYQYNTQSTFSATFAIKGIPAESIYATVISDPTDIDDLWIWLDANVGVTGTTTVTAWADQSGNGNNVAATSGQEPEKISSAINSLPAISSYGLGAKMQTSVNMPDLSAGGTVFVVGKQSLDDGATNFDAGGVFVGAGSAVNMEMRRGTLSSGGAVSLRGAIDAATYAQTTPLIEEDTFYSLRLVNDGTTNKVAVNNGTEGTATADGTGYLATPFSIFKTLGGAQGNKQIAEIILYTRELTAGEIAAVETYLNEKYDLY